MEKTLLFALLTVLPLLFPDSAARAAIDTSVILSDACVRGNGTIETVERQAGVFNILDTAGTYNLNIKSGNYKQRVRITGESNLLPLVSTSSQGNKLVIHLEKSICTEMVITVDVEVFDLNALVVSGSENVKVEDIYTEKFILDMSGNANAELSGNALALDASMSGAGSLEARDLKTRETTLNISGTGSANVHATERLKVDIYGVADVNYFGQPKVIEQEIQGLGELNPRD